MCPYSEKENTVYMANKNKYSPNTADFMHESPLQPCKMLCKIYRADCKQAKDCVSKTAIKTTTDTNSVPGLHVNNTS